MHVGGEKYNQIFTWSDHSNWAFPGRKYSTKRAKARVSTVQTGQVKWHGDPMVMWPEIPSFEFFLGTVWMVHTREWYVHDLLEDSSTLNSVHCKVEQIFQNDGKNPPDRNSRWQSTWAWFRFGRQVICFGWSSMLIESFSVIHLYRGWYLAVLTSAFS